MTDTIVGIPVVFVLLICLVGVAGFCRYWYAKRRSEQLSLLASSPQVASASLLHGSTNQIPAPQGIHGVAPGVPVCMYGSLPEADAGRAVTDQAEPSWAQQEFIGYGVPSSQPQGFSNE